MNETLEHVSIDEIIELMERLEGVLILRPGPGDGSPELSWGDSFFYYAPDGKVPTTTQPFATIVTKDHPGDESSRLNRRDTFRVNVFAGKDTFVQLVGREPRDRAVDEVDPSTFDNVIAHPVYGELGWLAVVNPGPQTEAVVRDLLHRAYDRARNRHHRRAAVDA